MRGRRQEITWAFVWRLTGQIVQALDLRPSAALASAPCVCVKFVTNKNRIMIYGLKPDDTYVIEFETANGQTLAISMPGGEWAALKYFLGLSRVAELAPCPRPEDVSRYVDGLR